MARLFSNSRVSASLVATIACNLLPVIAGDDISVAKSKAGVILKALGCKLDISKFSQEISRVPALPSFSAMWSGEDQNLARVKIDYSSRMNTFWIHTEGMKERNWNSPEQAKAFLLQCGRKISPSGKAMITDFLMSSETLPGNEHSPKYQPMTIKPGYLMTRVAFLIEGYPVLNTLYGIEGEFNAVNGTPQHIKVVLQSPFPNVHITTPVSLEIAKEEIKRLRPTLTLTGKPWQLGWFSFPIGDRRPVLTYVFLKPNKSVINENMQRAPICFEAKLNGRIFVLPEHHLRNTPSGN